MLILFILPLVFYSFFTHLENEKKEVMIVFNAKEREKFLKKKII